MGLTRNLSDETQSLRSSSLLAVDGASEARWSAAGTVPEPKLAAGAEQALLTPALRQRFEQEVLGGAAESLRRALVVAAIPELVEPGILQRLATEAQLAPPSLPALAESCPFLTQVRQDSSAYEFQAPFRQFLLEQLASADWVTATRLQSCAARWFLERGDALQALEHGLLSREAETNLDVLIEVAAPLLRRRDMQALEHLAKATTPLWGRSPWGPAMLAFCAVHASNGREACRLIELAEASLSRAPTETSLAAQLQVWAAWIRAEAARLLDQASSALEIVHACLVEQPALDGIWLAGLLNVLGNAQVQVGDYAAALTSFERAAEVARRDGADYDASAALLGRARALRLWGRAAEARNACAATLDELLRQPQRCSVLLGQAYLERAALLLEAGDATSAASSATRAVEELQDVRRSYELAEAYELLARSHELLGDRRSALRAASAAVQSAPGDAHPLLARRLNALRDSLTSVATSAFPGNATLDAHNRSVVCGDQVIALTRREFEILDYLCRHRGRWVPSNEIVANVFHSVQQQRSTLVRVHVHAIRQKLGLQRDLIQSERGRGYRAQPEIGLSGVSE